MRRTAVTLMVVGLFAACGFPEVGYDGGADAGGADVTSNPDAPTGAEGSSGDGGADTTSGNDATSEAPADAPPETSTEGGDSSTVTETGADGPFTDADAMRDASGDSTTGDAPTDAVADQAVDSPPDALDCDKDQDGFKSAVAGCNGNDCCDTDAKAHPGVTTYYITPDACGSFDYNCNGTLDQEFAENVPCSGNSITGCVGSAGFTGSPACGASGPYQSACVLNGLLKCVTSNDPDAADPGLLLTVLLRCGSCPSCRTSRSTSST